MPNPENPKERLIQGCQVFLPETVFFRDGQLEFSSMMDKDNCIALETKSKNQRSEIIKWIKEVVKQRQIDTEQFKNELSVLQRMQKHGKELSKELASYKSSTELSKTTSQAVSSSVSAKDRKGQKKPCAIFKFKSEDSSLVDKTQGLSEVKLEHEF